MSINDISQQFIKQLTDEFLLTTTNQIRNQVTIDIVQKITDFDIAGEIKKQINQAVGNAIQAYSGDANLLTNGLLSEYRTQTQTFLEDVTAQVKNKVFADLYDKINAINIEQLIIAQTNTMVADLVKNINFPAKSIGADSINTENLKVSADNVTKGIIKNFESTGIQDGASRCQLTIFDEATVVENKLFSRDIEIQGRAKFNGQVEFSADLPDSSPFIQKIVGTTIKHIEQQYDSGTFDQYCTRVWDLINTQGISPASIRINSEPLVANNTLAGTITMSNLQQVGALRELQVIGETLLDETVYVSNKRLGLNTIEPEKVFDMWDQEVQIVAGKRMKDTAIIGTPRNQSLILSSANREQLVVNPDGSVTIQFLNINKVRHSSSVHEPRDNRPIGYIVWNEQPQIGMPVGWVSLGGARWGKIGTVTN